MLIIANLSQFVYCLQHMDRESQLRSFLKARQLSVTSVRRKVFSALDKHEPRSMAELIAALPSIDRASIYRTVSLFEKLGIVRRVQIGWKYKLELSEEFNYHHHHISCTNCGNIFPIREDKNLEAIINSLAYEYGFKPTDHQLEIQGLCAKCRDTM